MTDENEDYGTGKQQIIFRETVKRYADFKTQLQYDSLKIAKFLRNCVTFYLEKDPQMMELVDKMKGINKPKPVKPKEVKIAQTERKQEQKIVSEFTLNPDDVENIYDLLEEENPEL